MNLLSKVLRLSPRLYFLYLEVTLLSAITRLAILLVPFRQLAKTLVTGNTSLDNTLPVDSALLIEEIGLAVTRVSRFTPWRCMCLEQGLMAKVLLWQRGIPSTLVFGVANQSEGEMTAHAWLLCEKKVVVGAKGMEEFSPIATFT